MISRVEVGEFLQKSSPVQRNFQGRFNSPIINPDIPRVAPNSVVHHFGRTEFRNQQVNGSTIKTGNVWGVGEPATGCNQTSTTSNRRVQTAPENTLDFQNSPHIYSSINTNYKLDSKTSSSCFTQQQSPAFCNEEVPADEQQGAEGLHQIFDATDVEDGSEKRMKKKKKKKKNKKKKHYFVEEQDEFETGFQQFDNLFKIKKKRDRVASKSKRKRSTIGDHEDDFSINKNEEWSLEDKETIPTDIDKNENDRSFEGTLSKRRKAGSRKSYSFGRGATSMKEAIYYTQQLLEAHEKGLKSITIEVESQEHTVSSISQIATLFEVPKTTLYGRYKGDPESIIKPGRKEAFSFEAEEMMVRQINWLVQNGFALSWLNVRSYAQGLAASQNMKGFKASHTWLLHFLMRHEGAAASLRVAGERLRASCPEPPQTLSFLLDYISQMQPSHMLDDPSSFDVPDEKAAMFIMYQVLKESNEDRQKRIISQAIDKERRLSLGLAREKRNRYKKAEDLRRMEAAVACVQQLEDARFRGERTVEIEVGEEKHEVCSVTQIKDLFQIPSQTLRSWVERKNKFVIDLPASANKGLLYHLQWMIGKGVGFEWDYVHQRAEELAQLGDIQGFRALGWAKKFRTQNPEMLNIMHVASRNLLENQLDGVTDPLQGVENICHKMMKELKELDMVKQTIVLSKFEAIIKFSKTSSIEDLLQDFQKTDSTCFADPAESLPVKSEEKPNRLIQSELRQPNFSETSNYVPLQIHNPIQSQNTSGQFLSDGVHELMPSSVLDAMLPIPMTLDSDSMMYPSNFIFKHNKEMSV